MSAPDFRPIDTDRLRLRRFRAEDAPAFARYRADPEVARFQGWEAGYPLAQAETFVAEMATARPGVPGGWFQVAIADPASDELIGDCVLHLLPQDPEIVEIGYTIAPEHQGNGYATEAARALIAYAFDGLGVRIVRATADARNVASIRVAERLGMTHTSTTHTTFKGAPSEERAYEVRRGA